MSSDSDLNEAKQTLATLLDMNEPEALVASLRLMCERKAQDRFIGDTERNRWKAAAEALGDVLVELERGQAPQAKPAGPSFAPDPQNPQHIQTAPTGEDKPLA